MGRGCAASGETSPADTSTRDTQPPALPPAALPALECGPPAVGCVIPTPSCPHINPRLSVTAVGISMMDCLQSYVLGSAHVHYHNVIIIEAFGKQLGVFSTPPPPAPSLVFLQFSCCCSLLGFHRTFGRPCLVSNTKYAKIKRPQSRAI